MQLLHVPSVGVHVFFTQKPPAQSPSFVQLVYATGRQAPAPASHVAQTPLLPAAHSRQYSPPASPQSTFCMQDFGLVALRHAIEPRHASSKMHVACAPLAAQSASDRQPEVETTLPLLLLEDGELDDAPPAPVVNVFCIWPFPEQLATSRLRMAAAARPNRRTFMPFKLSRSRCAPVRAERSLPFQGASFDAIR
jgi:hypothetical protein